MQTRVYYAAQIRCEPPTIVLVVNHPALFKPGYMRFLENRLREIVPFPEVPFRIVVRGRRRDDPMHEPDPGRQATGQRTGQRTGQGVRPGALPPGAEAGEPVLLEGISQEEIDQILADIPAEADAYFDDEPEDSAESPSRRSCGIAGPRRGTILAMAEPGRPGRRGGDQDGRAPGEPSRGRVGVRRLPEADAADLHSADARPAGDDGPAPSRSWRAMSGMHRSPHHGFSVEFAQHRPYVAGDDVRHLDWKVFGRTDKLHLKQYQQETALDLIVMVDSSGSMGYGSRSFESASGQGRRTSPDGRAYWSKFDHATAVAAAISYITLQQGDRVGVAVFADGVRTMLARSSQRGMWRQVVGALSGHPVDAPTDLGRSLVTLARLTNRCLIALVSDLFEDPERIRAALARVRHRGHDLICFQVLDRAETEFDFSDSAPFEGLEGEGRVRVDPRSLRQAYLEALGEHQRAIQKLMLGFGFDHQRISTHEWLGPALAAFVARRHAQIKSSKYG